MKQRLHHPVLILILTAVLMLSGCGLLPSGTLSFGKSDKDSQYYVEIPADTVLISYEGDINALKNDLAEAIANCEKSLERIAAYFFLELLLIGRNICCMMN